MVTDIIRETCDSRTCRHETAPPANHADARCGIPGFGTPADCDARAHAERIFIMLATSVAAELVPQRLWDQELTGEALVSHRTRPRCLLLTPIVIAIHRFVISDKITPNYTVPIGEPVFGIFFRPGLLALKVLIGLPIDLLGLLQTFNWSLPASTLAFALALIAAVGVSLRMTILLPALAVEAPGATLSYALDTKGHVCESSPFFPGVGAVACRRCRWCSLIGPGAMITGSPLAMLTLVMGGVRKRSRLAYRSDRLPRVHGSRRTGQARGTAAWSCVATEVNPPSYFPGVTRLSAPLGPCPSVIGDRFAMVAACPLPPPIATKSPHHSNQWMRHTRQLGRDTLPKIAADVMRWGRGKWQSTLGGGNSQPASAELHCVAAFAVRAQPAANAAKIGVLYLGARPCSAFAWSSIRKGLHQLGYVEGQNVAIEPSVCFGRSSPASRAGCRAGPTKRRCHHHIRRSCYQIAQQATSTVPIVAIGDDLHGSGLIGSSQPGGNTTGLTILLRNSAQND